MPKTPDSSSGRDFIEDEITFDAMSEDPPAAPKMRYVSGAFRFRDALGVYDPRYGEIDPETHAAFRQLIHLSDGDGPFEGFASGAYCEITGGAFPSAMIWYTANDKAHKIVEKLITRDAGQKPTTIVWKVYSAADVLLATVTDTITYSGPFETSRTRTVA